MPYWISSMVPPIFKKCYVVLEINWMLLIEVGNCYLHILYCSALILFVLISVICSLRACRWTINGISFSPFSMSCELSIEFVCELWNPIRQYFRNNILEMVSTTIPIPSPPFSMSFFIKRVYGQQNRIHQNGILEMVSTTIVILTFKCSCLCDLCAICHLVEYVMNGVGEITRASRWSAWLV